MGVFGALIGVFTDRIDRRTALLLVLSMAFATSLTLTVISFSGNLQIWQLAVASFIGGLGWAADNPVRRMMIGEIARPERLGLAMTIDVGANNGCRIAGPIIGGILLVSTGITGVFVLDTILLLAALLAATRIRYRSFVNAQSIRKTLSRLGDAFKLGACDVHLRGIFILTLVNALFALPYTSMIPIIGKDALNLDAAGVGILASMEGIGAFVAVFGVALRAGTSRYGLILVTGIVMYQIAVIAFGVSPDPVSACIIVLAGGAGNAAVAIMQTTLTISSVSTEMRSRMLGVLATCNGSAILGFIFIGRLADLMGARIAVVTIGVIGALLLVLTFPWWWFLVRPLGLPEKPGRD